jgi:tetratricopeptide (TPR) repeat protein
MLTCRSEALDMLDRTGLPALAQTRLLSLPALTRAEVTQLIATMTADRGDDSALAPLDLLMDRTSGNPLYVAELVRYWARPGQSAAAAPDRVPATLQRLILARVDQLPPAQQDLLKVASMLDDTIYPPWVCGFYPAVGSLEATWSQCDDLCQRAFLRPQVVTGLESYGFLHSLTQDAVYESLVYATRSRLHEQYAVYLEGSLPDASTSMVYRLAYHYGRSPNLPKKRQALRAAGDLARQTYANQTAIQYYTALLNCELAPSEAVTALGLLGDVCEAAGELAAAIGHYERALLLAVAEDAPAQEAMCCYRLGVLERVRSDFAAAMTWLHRAAALYTVLADRAGSTQVQTQLGAVYWSQQRYDQAQPMLDAAVAMAEQLQDPRLLAESLAIRGNLGYTRGAYAHAMDDYQRSYAGFLQLNNLMRATTIATNMAAVAYVQGFYTTARESLEHLLPIATAIGVKNNIAFLYGHLATIAYVQGDLDKAQDLAATAVQVYRQIGAGRALANELQTFGSILYGQRQFMQAKAALEEALGLARTLGTQDILVSVLNVLGALACRQGDLATAQLLLEEGLQVADQIQASWDSALLLLNLSDVRRTQGDPRGAWDACRQSLHRAVAIEAAAIIPQGAIRIAQLLLDATPGLADVAMQLASGADALLTHGGGVLEPDEAEIAAAVLTRARAVLSPAALAQAEEQGRTLTGAQLVALVDAHGRERAGAAQEP